MDIFAYSEDNAIARLVLISWRELSYYMLELCFPPHDWGGHENHQLTDMTNIILCSVVFNSCY